MNWYSLVWPLVRRIDPERAHGLTMRLLATGLLPKAPRRNLTRLGTRVFGLDFQSPVGLAAGFDKDARVPDAMLAQGFGFVEVGSVTPRPQTGNPRPRLFRLERDQAVINRMGFNNVGAAVVARRLGLRRGRGGIVGVNLGANRDSEDRAADYLSGFLTLHGLADYFVVNVSSPNTPGLRDLQERHQLTDLLSRLLESRAELTALQAEAGPVPLLLKVSPDLGEAEVDAVAEVAVSTGIDGLIVANTTTGHRDMLASDMRHEPGGLSGAPLFSPSTDLLRRLYGLTGGRLPLVGVGGISGGREAYAKIRAGASLIQLYTALIYQGPGLVDRINLDLDRYIERDGFASVADAVGTDAG